MIRSGIQCKFLFLFALLALNVFTKSLPIDKSSVLHVSVTSLPKLETSKFDGSQMISDSERKTFKSDVAENARPNNETVPTDDDVQIDASEVSTNLTRNVRPGQVVHGYSVKISFDENGIFNGEVVINVEVDSATSDEPIIFHLEALDVHEVRTGLASVDTTEEAEFNIGVGIIEIYPNNIDSTDSVIIKYSGEISNSGKGVFQGGVNDYRYVGMNLYPTNARRVFPCMDELQAFTTISFTFENVPFDEIVSNSRTEDGNPNQFSALQVPPHLWGMVAHNFINIAIPETNVILYGRSGLNQNSLASIAISDFFTSYNEKLNKEYSTIIVNQDGRLHIFALPDTNVEWNALSTICIWEPYILMPNTHSMMQRKTALVKIAEGMARQWFGFVVYPEDWKDQWVISGLASHAAQDVVIDFQSSDIEDITLLDMNTIFTTDVIREALLLDSYSSAVVLSPEDDILDEPDIRHHTLGLLRLKAPTIMRMLRLVLGDEDNDYILRAGQILLNNRALTPISVSDFVEAVGSAWPGNDNIDDIGEFLEPWIQNTGYPVLHVGWSSDNTVLLTQEHFSFTSSNTVEYIIPVTFTTNLQQNYDNVYPTRMMGDTVEIPLPDTLHEDDYVIFNIQGQGYYRVNYDLEHWDRIISALDNADRRQAIHPLNRAVLIDDALNLARGGKLDYDVALRLVLTWVHETEYAPWKAFIKNMEFLQNGLLGAVSNNRDLDPDIYMRMVRRTIGTFEDEVSFSPNPSINEPAMRSLTRGIVMDHVCRSNYDPCTAAAIDWFYDTSSDEPAVNPNIPIDIQPAVFCTMVREAGAEAINLLYVYLDTDISYYDRLVVLESLACSLDEDFIDKLMMDTISEDGPFGSEERSKVLAAIIRSGYDNVFRAINFMRANTNNIRDMYGGPQKLEELLFGLADNIVNDRLDSYFRVWVTSNINNLDDSKVIAERALQNSQENVQWTRRSLDEVYVWFDENDAHTIVVSVTLLCFTALVSLFNL